MQEGLIHTREYPDGIIADVWCAKNASENSSDFDDFATIEMRFSTRYFAKREDVIKQRFQKMWSGLDFDCLKSTGEAVLEFTCTNIDGKLWNCVIAHCKTASITDYIISTFASCIDSPHRD